MKYSHHQTKYVRKYVGLRTYQHPGITLSEPRLSIIVCVVLRGGGEKNMQGVLCTISAGCVLFLQEVSEALGSIWAPLPNSQLHDVIHNPTAGDSDEFILPIVLKDQDP